MLDPAVVRFDTTCGSVSCKLGSKLRAGEDAAVAAAMERQRAEREASEADLAAKEQSLRAAEARAGRSVDGRVLLAPLPGQRLGLEPLDPHRAQLFLEHVGDLLDEVSSDPEGPIGPPLPPTRVGFHAMAESEGEPGPLEGLACSACRGFCCQRGGWKAFHDAESIRRVVASRPAGATRRELLAEFAAWLPERAVAGSCVFHTEQGCAQPRSLRSPTCNRYRCPELRRLLVLSGSGDYDRAVVGSFVARELHEHASVDLDGEAVGRG